MYSGGKKNLTELVRLVGDIMKTTEDLSLTIIKKLEVEKNILGQKWEGITELAPAQCLHTILSKDHSDGTELQRTEQLHFFGYKTVVEE